MMKKISKLVKTILRRCAARMPLRWQQELKRIYYAWQIRHGSFTSSEKEFETLSAFVDEGFLVIDIGANIGHYTVKLSQLVGPTGRVVACEPVPKTFELLAANVQLLQHQNVTVLNLAVSDKWNIVGMQVPSFETGLRNYYKASVDETVKDCMVLCACLDAFDFPQAIGLVKIDVEGHELNVLKGMTRLLLRDHPVLIVETESQNVISFLREIGYESEHLPDSPNVIFTKAVLNDSVYIPTEISHR